MAKFNFGKIKENEEPKKEKENISGSKLLVKIEKLASDAVALADDVTEELSEIGGAGLNALYAGAGGLITVLDIFLDWAFYWIYRFIVGVGRSWHGAREFLWEERKEVLKYIVFLMSAMIGIAALISYETDYEYSYNGRVLGVVRNQNDVLDVLDLASEELSQEYGSNIKIDPEEEITFRPIIANGVETDSEDMVLKRLTYMTSINAQAFGIYANNELLVIVENKENAKAVLESIKSIYMSKSSSVKYEKVGFAEEIDIKPINTTLSKILSVEDAVKFIKSGGQEQVVYKVKNGDTIYGICSKLGISTSELFEMNPSYNINSVLHAGDKFVTKKEVPLITLETVEVSTFAEAIEYKTEYKNSNKYYVGENVVVRAGKNGKASVTARLTRHNGEIVEREDISKEVLSQPTSKIVYKGTKPAPPRKGTGTYKRPCGGIITCDYGWDADWGRYHYGVDFATKSGTPIKASDGGTVVETGWDSQFGYYVVIDHGANIKTKYAHCSKIYVKSGQKVYQGEKIAAVGSTGLSTGPHCHFEVHVNGTRVNPWKYLS